MVEYETNEVQTKPVGFAPILDHYFKRAGICEIIDDHVDLDPRRKILSHGEACVAMTTAILFQVLQLYRLCKFAEDSTVLETVLPGIAPEEYFDDRLADTLDAIYDYGLGNLEALITKKMIEEFDIDTDICHNDTTSASVYGDCDNRRTEDGLKITFGYSKKHRQDLKQLVWSLSVSDDHAFPLFQQAYDGNTSDVDTYVEQWCNLIDLLGREDFLFVCDSKLVTFENMAHIDGNEGFFLAPAPMYETYKSVFEEAVASHDSEVLIEYKKKFNRGFETPVKITYAKKEYEFRMVIIFDHGLLKIKKKSLESRKDKTRLAFEQLGGKLNKYKLKEEHAIENACEAIPEKVRHPEHFQLFLGQRAQDRLEEREERPPGKKQKTRKNSRAYRQLANRPGIRSGDLRKGTVALRLLSSDNQQARRRPFNRRRHDGPQEPAQGGTYKQESQKRPQPRTHLSAYPGTYRILLVPFQNSVADRRAAGKDCQAKYRKERKRAGRFHAEPKGRQKPEGRILAGGIRICSQKAKFRCQAATTADSSRS